MKKTVELSQLRGAGKDELEKIISDSEEEMMRLRFKKASGQLDDSAQINTLRKKIARAKTVLKQQQLAA